MKTIIKSIPIIDNLNNYSQDVDVYLQYFFGLCFVFK